MSGSQRRHHRRRTGSSSRRYRPSELVPIETHRRYHIGVPQILASVAVAVVAALLITLIWIVTNRTALDQRAETRERAEQALSAQAALLADQVRHELLMVDQSLTIIQDAWKQDSDKVDLATWQKSLQALTSVADDIFIADENHIIRQDILPTAIGQGIGSAYVTFPRGSLETFDGDGTLARDGRLAIADITTPIDGREYLMYLVRPLNHPLHWIVGASFRSDQLARLFAASNLGTNGIAALIDMRMGGVQAIIGPAARQPKTDVSRSPMYEAVRKSDSGIWLGPTAMDGAERLIAYHRVQGRDLIAIVGTSWAEAMAPADSIAEGYGSVAAGATLVLVIGAGLVLWELYNFRSNARRRRHLERSQTDLLSLQSELAGIKTRAQLTSMQLHILMEGLGDGIAVLDAQLGLSVWNAAFAAVTWLEPALLHVGLPLDELLRRQAAAGAFGPLENPEAEIAQRVATLRIERDRTELRQFGPSDETIALHARSLPDGGLLLMLGGPRQWQTQPLPTVAPVAAPQEEEAAAGAAVIEW